MKQLLRGIIDFGSLSSEGMEVNFQRLVDSRIEWVQPEDERIFRFVSEFFQDRLELPSGKLMSEYFSRDENIEVVERLKDIEAATPHEGANFKFVLDGALEDQAKRTIKDRLRKINEILGKGLVIKEGRKERLLHGVSDAVTYLDDADLRSLDTSKPRPLVRTDLREATRQTLADYDEAHANPSSAFGVCSGFEPVDVACHGLKPGELWIHAGYTGEMKSTLAQNVAYAAMTRYRRNVVYVSLEMTLKQFRRSIHVMHSAHPRWAIQGKVPLDYRKVRDGELSVEERDFLVEVLEDFDTNSEYCSFDAITVNERPTLETITAELLKIDRQKEVGLVIVDHAGLVEPSKSNQNYGVEMNSILHALRELSLHFAGRGVPVLVLQQINRKGKDQAVKDGGEYRALDILSWSNESERSASLITWSYLDPALRKLGQLRVGCLKNRDNPLFDTFELDIAWGPKKLTYQSPETSELARQMTEDFSTLDLGSV